MSAYSANLLLEPEFSPMQCCKHDYAIPWTSHHCHQIVIVHLVCNNSVLIQSGVMIQRSEAHTVDLTQYIIGRLLFSWDARFSGPSCLGWSNFQCNQV
jgi:hypothetical protein